MRERRRHRDLSRLLALQGVLERQASLECARALAAERAEAENLDRAQSELDHVQTAWSHFIQRGGFDAPRYIAFSAFVDHQHQETARAEAEAADARERLAQTQLRKMQREAEIRQTTKALHRLRRRLVRRAEDKALMQAEDKITARSLDR